MARIQQFNIIQPPTSGEVRTQALGALECKGVLKLTILGKQDLPKPELSSVEVQVRDAHQPDNEGLRFGGTDAEGNSVRIRTEADPELPATAYFDLVSAVKQRVPGTGLGLASAKCIIEAHGGEIWVDSSPGSGSVFHISLPAIMDVCDERSESLERR